LKGSITKKLVMTYSAVLGVFLAITVFLFNITARRYMENNIVKNLHAESAIIEELYLERVSAPADTDGENNIKETRKAIRRWFSDIKKLAGIGFSSDIALVLKTRDSKFGIFTSGDTQNDFRSISAEELSSQLRDEPYFFEIEGGETSFFSVSRPLPQGHGENQNLRAWIVAYSPVYELDHLVRDMNLKAAYSIGIALAAAAFLSWYLSVNITKPVKALKNYAERLAARDFKARVDIDTGDEIEALGQAMNKIAGDLNEYGLSQRRFLQNVTHELKTPVMSIRGYAEGLRDGVVDNQEKALDIMIGECGRLQRLVNEVLYLSKLETVEEFYSFRSETLNEVIHEVREKMQTIIDQSALTLQLRLDRNCSVDMDRDKLIQALLNLLSNAVRYAESTITVQTRVLGREVQIMIWNDGTGMSDQDLKQVFERFYKGKKGSTGLGMTITRAIVEKHKGSITAGNHPEGGAVFELSFPLSQ